VFEALNAGGVQCWPWDPQSQPGVTRDRDPASEIYYISCNELKVWLFVRPAQFTVPAEVCDVLPIFDNETIVGGPNFLVSSPWVHRKPDEVAGALGGDVTTRLDFYAALCASMRPEEAPSG
jgi:hypothetical protein